MIDDPLPNKSFLGFSFFIFFGFLRIFLPGAICDFCRFFRFWGFLTHLPRGWGVQKLIGFFLDFRRFMVKSVWRLASVVSALEQKHPLKLYYQKLTLARVVDADPHLDSDNVSLSFPASQVRPRRGLGETDRVRSDRVEVVVVFDIACYLVLIVVIWCRSSSCLFRVAVLRSNIHSGDPILSSVLFSKRIHFCILVFASHSSSRNPTHPPVFLAPRDFRPRKKCGFLCQKRPFLCNFRRFFCP